MYSVSQRQYEDATRKLLPWNLGFMVKWSASNNKRVDVRRLRVYTAEQICTINSTTQPVQQ